MCETAWGAGDRDVLARLLNCLDSALRNGDDHVSNAVAGSFVWDSGWWQPKLQDYVSFWPSALAAEVETQRAAGG